MEKTSAQVYFTIYGDEFPIDYPTKLLELKPTLTYKKGEEIVRKHNPHVTYTLKHYRKETAWEIGTDYEETNDLDEQINKVLKQLKNKEEKLTELCRTYNLKCLFMIVIKINEGITPAVSINKDFIKLADKIGAEIHFDIYANPYKSEFE